MECNDIEGLAKYRTIEKSKTMPTAKIMLVLCENNPIK